jgi:hypothetical protein
MRRSISMAKKTKRAVLKKTAGKVKRGPSKTSGSKSGAAKAAGKYVYLFGKKTDGDGTMKPLLGGKGANLAEMCRIGLPVPPGFTITTEVCTYYYEHKRSYPAALRSQMEAGVAAIEKQTGKKFGDLTNPLLVSVRSGARDSMPGMMDTILNLGLNDQTVEALAKKTTNPRFAIAVSSRCTAMSSSVCRSGPARITSRSRRSSRPSSTSATIRTSRTRSSRSRTSRNSSPASRRSCRSVPGRSSPRRRGTS